MMNSALSIIGIFILLTISACSRTDPGPLAGTWRMDGVMPLTVDFRTGETETMGLIEKVSYDVKGNNVIVSYQSGPMQGIAVRYIITDPNSAQAEFGVLHRIN